MYYITDIDYWTYTLSYDSNKYDVNVKISVNFQNY